MSDLNDLLPELQQADLKARLAADPFYTGVAIIARDEGAVDNDVATALGFLSGDNPSTKVGSCLVIEPPEYVDQSQGVSDAPMKMLWRILAIEHRELNIGELGTGLRAISLIRHARRVIRNYRAGGLTQQFIFKSIRRERDAVIWKQDGQPQPVICWAGEFEGQEGDFVPILKCAAVRISPREGAAPQSVTITGGQSGGTIYYSTDNTYPSVAYTGAFNVTSAKLVRAVCRKSGYVDSDVDAVNIS